MATKVYSRGIDSTHEDVFFYKTNSSLGQHHFVVPVKDMGVLPFEDKIAAQLLIRWLS